MKPRNGGLRCLSLIVRHYPWGRALGLDPHRCMLRSHGQSPAAFNDLFVVKYSAEQQQGLEVHTDAGDVSFMLALSPRSSYSGGGTAFDVLQQQGESPVHLEQGNAILFDARLRHEGLPISSGTRYLLVGFCLTDPAASRVPGNVGLGLQRIQGASSSFDVLYLRCSSHPPLDPSHLRSDAALPFSSLYLKVNRRRHAQSVRFPQRLWTHRCDP